MEGRAHQHPSGHQWPLYGPLAGPGCVCAGPLWGCVDSVRKRQQMGRAADQNNAETAGALVRPRLAFHIRFTVVSRDPFLARNKETGQTV